MNFLTKLVALSSKMNLREIEENEVERRKRRNENLKKILKQLKLHFLPIDLKIFTMYEKC